MARVNLNELRSSPWRGPEECPAVPEGWLWRSPGVEEWRWRLICGVPQTSRVLLNRRVARRPCRCPTRTPLTLSHPRKPPDLSQLSPRLAFPPTEGTNEIYDARLNSFWQSGRPPWPQQASTLSLTAPAVPSASPPWTLLKDLHTDHISENYALVNAQVFLPTLPLLPPFPSFSSRILVSLISLNKMTVTMTKNILI